MWMEFYLNWLLGYTLMVGILGATVMVPALVFLDWSGCLAERGERWVLASRLKCIALGIVKHQSNDNRSNHKEKTSHQNTGDDPSPTRSKSLGPHGAQGPIYHNRSGEPKKQG